MNTANYNTGRPSSFDLGTKTFKTMQLGEVVLVEPIIVNQTDDNQKNQDLTYNSDPYIIRCRIVGGEYDNNTPDNSKLPNCFPLMPKMASPIPKVGETVLLFMYSSEDRYSDRFYIGPIISNLNLLNKQTLTAGSTASLSTGFYLPQKDLSKVESVKGVYAEYDSDNTYTLNGRDNADIVFKPSEVLIRGGKFVQNNPLEFNQINPAYIQVKNGFNYTDNINNAITTITSYYGVGGPIFEPATKKISVNNIVADKINLLTYNGSPNFNLTQRDLLNSTTPYITDDELNTILSTAHPLVFGDILLEYLKAMRAAFDTHVHNQFGAAPPTDNKTIGNAVSDFRTLAPKLESVMLSKNVRTN
jgi:hypothetical protein